MTAVLIVISGMDPHTIRVTWIGMVGMLAVWSVLLFISNYHSGLCGRFDVGSHGEELLALVIAAWHLMHPPLSACQKPQSTFPCLKAPKPSFPPLAE
jgi:hypothetical protein